MHVPITHAIVTMEMRQQAHHVQSRVLQFVLHVGKTIIFTRVLVEHVIIGSVVQINTEQGFVKDQGMNSIVMIVETYLATLISIALEPATLQHKVFDVRSV